MYERTTGYLEEHRLRVIGISFDNSGRRSRSSIHPALLSIPAGQVRVHSRYPSQYPNLPAFCCFVHRLITNVPPPGSMTLELREGERTWQRSTVPCGRIP